MVISISPSNGATNAGTSTNINDKLTGTVVTAAFSQSMNPATIASSQPAALNTFTLKETTGTDVSSTVAMNAENTAAASSRRARPL